MSQDASSPRGGPPGLTSRPARSVPEEPLTELTHLAAHKQAHGTCLLCDYAKQEVERKERVVHLDEAGGWMAVVPWWATWPFEVMGESSRKEGRRARVC